MSAARHAADPSPGRQVGSYRLERRLGVGGMGEVWLGHHVTSGGLGAVKLAKRDHRDPSRRRAFVVREGRAVTRLRHPHVVNIFEVGDDFVVYQYIEGQDLRRRLQSPIDPAGAVRITRQIAAALAHAHAHGVVHRDVKPSNILLDTQRNAFLADFGLALVDSEGVPGTSRAGTPEFMAPEQARGEQVGAAADQYGLGRTLLEMLIGAQPPGEHAAAMALLPADLPAALAAIAARATQARSEDRFASLDELEAALAALDLSAYAPPVRLAPEVRGGGRFAWARGADQEVALAPDLARCDFRLSVLADRRLVDERGAHELLAREALVDVGWSLYGSPTRLGPLSSPSAPARAGEVIVLMHGWLSSRGVWSSIAPAICRDNARALVLAVDMWGGGLARYRGRPQPIHARLAAGPAVVQAVLELLGLTELPTVLVGHSLSGTALLDLGDEGAGPRASRVAVNPVFPYFVARYRRELVAGQAALRLLGLSRRAYARVIPTLVHRSPVATQLSAEARHECEREALALGPRHALTAGTALLAARAPTDKRHDRLTVLAGLRDPLTNDEERDAALVSLGLAPSQCVRLATGGHFPHVEAEDHPEWTARNQAEMVHAISHILAMTLVSPDSAGSSTRSRDDSSA